jgi:glycosyltransferase involved in cell wall biosynthesis
VTVCIAHYNRTATLRHAIDSVLQQTFQNFEIVIVDDGSNQVERQALMDLTELDERIRIKCQENRYLGATRNTGAREARGRYLLFMDDDNIAKPNELETFLKAYLTGNSDILVCFSDNFTGEGPVSESCLNGIRRLPIGQDLVFGLFRNVYGDSNCFMGQHIWEALGGFTEHYRIGLDDHELFTRATLQGYRIDVLPEALYYYRLNEKKMKRFHVNKNANFIRILKPYLDAKLVPAKMTPIYFSIRALYEKMQKYE